MSDGSINPFKAVMRYAAAGMDRQSARIGLVAENISNADTPGYQRKLLVPAPISNSGEAFRAARVLLDDSAGDRRFEPDHPMADPEGYVLGSNVSLVVEMADMREANRTYEASLNTFQQARSMYRSLIDILRR